MQTNSPLRLRRLIQLTAVAASSALMATGYAMPQAIHYGVSIGPGGEFGNSPTSRCEISENGRYVVFGSSASDLTLGDTNDHSDVFRQDLTTGVTERVSQGLGGLGSRYPDVSADGRFVVYQSESTDIVPGDTNDAWDVFLHDMELGVTERLSLTSTGAEAGSASLRPRITPDARYVVFESISGLVPSDTNGQWDVYRLDRQLNQLEIVSVKALGGQGNGRSDGATISHDGQRIAFSSRATNLVPGDMNTDYDVFLKDMTTGALTRMSAAADGVVRQHGPIGRRQSVVGHGLGREALNARALLCSRMMLPSTPESPRA